MLSVICTLTACASKPTATPTVANTPVPVAATSTPGPVMPTAAPEGSVINADLRLDPAVTQNADSLKISQYLYEGLVRLDESGKPAAGLAESWVVSDDQLDYIFTIRSGMTFSDGTAITPDVIAANFNRWFDPEDALHGQGTYATWQSIFLGFHGEKDAQGEAKSPVDGIQKVDQKTVLVHLNRPVPELLTDLANPAFAILSPGALAKGSYGGRDSAIVASGPYMLKAWTDAGLTLTPNPKYWGEAQTKDLTFGWKK